MIKKTSISLLILMAMVFSACQEGSSKTKEYPNFKEDRIISYEHVKHGDREDYGAVILFEYEMDNYTKYQISFLSCSCRAASVNYQHLMYVELNNNNASPEEATIRDLDFHYWGDSMVNPENGLTYKMFQEEFMPYLIYKSKQDLKGITTLRDLKDVEAVERNGQVVDFVDAYSGATVSVDNTLSILHALFDYHTDKYYK